MRRTLLLIVGVLLAFMASSLALVAGLVVEASLTPARTSVALFDAMAWVFASGVDGTTGQLVAASARTLCTALITICLVPVALVAAIAEVIERRSLVLLAGGTGLVTSALPTLLETAHGGASGAVSGHLMVLLFLTGVTAGFVFWLVAGTSRQSGP